jgi:drug/metabolite transporter (DMT)-like permease
VASWRFLLAALVLGALVVIHEGWPRWSVKEWLTLAPWAPAASFLYNLCFLYGMKMIEAGRGALVVALTPALVAASDWLLFGAPMSPTKALGIGLAMFRLPAGGHQRRSPYCCSPVRWASANG